MMAEKLCLQWNDFRENVKGAFASFKSDNDFADVTLVSQDGQKVEGHKVILAGSSPFFLNLFRKIKPAPSIIYMGGVKSEVLAAIVDFLYTGEASIFQENLDSFLAIAEELQLKGPTVQTNGSTKELSEKDQRLNPVQATETFEPEPVQRLKAEHGQIIKSYVDKIVFDARNVQELDEMVRSMMETTGSLILDRRGKMYVCKVCGKEGQSINIQQHIEAKHLEGVSIPCEHCAKMFRSRNTLSAHIRYNHKERL